MEGGILIIIIILGICACACVCVSFSGGAGGYFLYKRSQQPEEEDIEREHENDEPPFRNVNTRTNQSVPKNTARSSMHGPNRFVLNDSKIDNKKRKTQRGINIEAFSSSTASRNIPPIRSNKNTLAFKEGVTREIQDPRFRSKSQLRKSSTIQVGLVETPKNNDKWETGEWEECSKKCGSGIRKRSVVCKTNNCDEANKPKDENTCNVQECEWETGEWEQCSKECGGGVSFRSVYCPEEGSCKSEKPGTKKACNPQECKRAYEQYQGWCRTKNGNGDTPYRWKDGGVKDRQECQSECDSYSWCYAYGWGPGKGESEQCRLHGNDRNMLGPPFGKFTHASGSMEGCPGKGDGNSSTWCYVKKVTKDEC